MTPMFIHKTKTYFTVKYIFLVLKWKNDINYVLKLFNLEKLSLQWSLNLLKTLGMFMDYILLQNN